MRILFSKKNNAMFTWEHPIDHETKKKNICSSNNVDLKSIQFYSNGSLLGVPKFAGSSNGSSKVSTFGVCF